MTAHSETQLTEVLKCLTDLQELVKQQQIILQTQETEILRLKQQASPVADANNPKAETKKTSRRHLLKGLAVLAAGGAVALAGEKSAHAFNSLTSGTNVNFGISAAPTVQAFYSPTSGQFGVIGRSDDSTTLPNEAQYIGVLGLGGSGIGVHGYTSSPGGTNYGVKGVSEGGSGSAGVYGIAQKTIGSNSGVYGESLSSSGAGVKGTVTATSGPTYGVHGICQSNEGTGVFGYNASDNGTTYGVRGSVNSPQGYGGFFRGGRAQLRLEPSQSVGIPTGTHEKGEFYVDANGALYYCRRGGTPGTWVQLAS
jgi:hypothetical protein